MARLTGDTVTEAAQESLLTYITFRRNGTCLHFCRQMGLDQMGLDQMGINCVDKVHKRRDQTLVMLPKLSIT